jgi:hypothetical protein
MTLNAAAIDGISIAKKSHSLIAILVQFEALIASDLE